MKRVLLSAYACSPNKGSEEGNGWSWAINLARIGYEVHCLTNSLHRSEIEAALAASPVKGLTFHFVKLPFSLDERLAHGSFTIYLHYKLWQRSAGKTACRMHAAKPFDIGHHVTYGSLQQGSFLWRLAGIQLIFGPVGGGQQAPHALKHYFGKAWKIEQLRSLISRWSMRHNKNLRNTLQAADHVLVTNKDTEAMVLKTGLVQPGKMQLVLDNAVPPSMESLAYNEPAQAGVLKLLWVGRVMPRKGLNLVLHALS
ncbi:MAG: glycosyltransferase, partial [Sphingobacteriales bacterium]